MYLICPCLSLDLALNDIEMIGKNATKDYVKEETN